jgi:hypothetical protein
MRVAVVRSDLKYISLDDVESRSQRCFSSEPAGQSRNLRKPTDSELTALLTKYGVAGSLSALKTAVYPSPTTVNVSTGTIQAVTGISGLGSVPKAALTVEIQDMVAPRFVETGPVLLSFVLGKLSILRSASFRPGGVRGGLPAGLAIAAVADDGSTPYVLL